MDNSMHEESQRDAHQIQTTTQLPWHVGRLPEFVLFLPQKLADRWVMDIQLAQAVQLHCQALQHLLIPISELM